jgi:peptidoglycan/xylan/chitin deacetylase (PgdA/CDA1 family)
MAKDPWWESFCIMLEIEKRYGVRSTLFFIPFPRRPGHTPKGKRAPNNRAAYYELEDYRSLLQQLERDGWEVGIHGIDAYRELESAKAELEAIRRLLPGKNRMGIRMHWLYHLGNKTWKILEAAGYAYDATFGWNDRVGFPGGQYRPFIPKEISLVVLPLNIQDGALLGEWHQFLEKHEAWQRAEQVLTEAKEVGAVVTVLWHNNSFAAPRYWGWLYERILQRAKKDGACICRASDVVFDVSQG